MYLDKTVQLTIEFSHGLLCRDGELELHEGVPRLHENLPHSSILAEQQSDGFLVPLGAQISHVELCHLFNG